MTLIRLPEAFSTNQYSPGLMNTSLSSTPAVMESVAVRGNFFLLEPAWARCRQADGIGGADSRVDKATVSSKRKIVCVRAYISKWH